MIYDSVVIVLFIVFSGKHCCRTFIVLAVFCAAYMLLDLPGSYLQSHQESGRDVSPMHQEVAPCKPTINLSFVKIHRCGSGTFHNTLVNFAIKHNAFVALAYCKWYELFPYQLSSDLLLPSPQHPAFRGYNMFIDHAIFNHTASNQVLPSSVVYITQIRHPFTQAFSAYRKLAGSKLGYSKFLSDPITYEKSIQTGGLCPNAKTPRMKISPSRNVMAQELGYTKTSENNVSDFEVYLKKLDSELLHVSILEELPESLVLLRHKLCWKFQDVLHLRLHTVKKRVPKNQQYVPKNQQHVPKNQQYVPKSQKHVLQAKQGPLRVETFISSTWNTQVKRAFRNSSQNSQDTTWQLSERHDDNTSSHNI